MRETAEETFKDFVAKQSSGLDGTTVIDWRNRNGSGTNSCLFTLTGNYMFVAGDLGEAVFVLTEPARLERIVKYDIQYLIEKMACGDSGYVYDQEDAFHELNKKVEEMKKDISGQPDAEEKLENLQNAVDELELEFNTREGFVHFGVESAVEAMYSFDSGVMEWLPYCGHRIARRPYMWMTALRMANMQLSRKATFLSQLTTIGEWANQRASLVQKIEDMLSELEEDEDVLSPVVICLEGIRFMDGVIVDGDLYSVEDGDAKTILARGKCQKLRRYEYKEDGNDEPELVDSLEYYVNQRVGYCEDDFYGTMYFILSEDNTGICKLLACPYEC